ncbi:MAG: hypothetical protein ACJATV_000010 [Granulosicoccus sp.]
MLTLDKLPKATTLGDGLRLIGAEPHIADAWVKVNRAVLQSALHHCKKITLDIDATEIIASKADTQWTCNKNKGFMPMLGHIAEAGQVVAVDFREGNTSPAKGNLEFIKQCQRSLPEDCTVNALRIDAAGYQTNIIRYCDDNAIEYAIRAKTNATMRAQIAVIEETGCEQLLDNQGNVVSGQDNYRTSYCLGNYERPFTQIFQRKAINGQAALDLAAANDAEEISVGGYVYRAVATNRDPLSNSEILHWYNQRTEDSKNRIKELKLDFGGDTLPSQTITQMHCTF